MSKFIGSSWSIDLLPEWIGEHEEDCSTIYHPDGVGALQISSYKKDSIVEEDDLRNLAQDHVEAGAKLSPANSGQFNGFTLAFGAEGQFWQYWYVANNNTALLLTYNCEEVDLGPERDEVKSMVGTLAAT